MFMSENFKKFETPKKEKIELSDLVFGKIAELANRGRFSPEDFNELLNLLEGKKIIRPEKNESRIKYYKGEQVKDREKVIFIESLDEKPVLFRPGDKFSPLTVEGQIFEFLPELREKTFRAEKEKKKDEASRDKYLAARAEKDKTLLATFDAALKPARTVTENLQKQMPAYEKNRPGAAVDFLWNKSKTLSSLLAEEKLNEAQEVVGGFKAANLREFSKAMFEGEILAAAKNAGLIEQAASKTFDWKARDQAKKENRPLMEKPQDFEFQYRHWETDPKTDRPILQIDLYRFIGNKGSAVQKSIFNELKHYSRFIEPLEKIAHLREEYSEKRQLAESTARFQSKLDARLGRTPVKETPDYHDQALEIQKRFNKKEERPKKFGEHGKKQKLAKIREEEQGRGLEE